MKSKKHIVRSCSNVFYVMRPSRVDIWDFQNRLYALCQGLEFRDVAFVSLPVYV